MSGMSEWDDQIEPQLWLYLFGPDSDHKSISSVFCPKKSNFHYRGPKIALPILTPHCKFLIFDLEGFRKENR